MVGGGCDALDTGAAKSMIWQLGILTTRIPPGKSSFVS
jgi:hypothetical protein